MKRRGRRRGGKPDVLLPPVNLPEELVFEILSWLPVKSLLQFRSVCKSWLSLISSPNFAKTQHNRAAINRNHPSSLIIFGSEKKKFISFIIRLGSVKNQAIKLKPPITSAKTLLVGCCDGIVCLKSLGCIYLWNPATQQAKELPNDYLWSRATKLAKQILSPYQCCDSIGFGLDPLSGDYKVVSMFYVVGTVRFVQVYSANSGSWKEIEVEELSIGESNVLIETADACVKGVLYWKSFGGFELVSFDLHNEVVGLIPMPSCVKLEKYRDHLLNTCTVVEFRDSAAMIVYSRNKATFSLWTMDDGFGEIGRSWTNKFTFEAVSWMVWLHGYLKTGQDCSI